MVQNGLKVNLPLNGGGLMEECKGCFMYSNGICIKELDKAMSKEDICPCCNCIVKTMCQDECRKFLQYERRRANVNKRSV